MEYYILGYKNNPHTPGIDFVNIDDKDLFFEDETATFTNPIRMCLRKPKPTKVEMTDFHPLPSIPIFSEKLYRVLFSLDLFKVQWIPATIELSKNSTISNYWLMHNFNHVGSMDLEKSDCKINKFGRVSWIQKIVLSPEKLAKVPLEERLFFRMKEDFPTHLVHKSIVDKILEQNPEGIKFTPIEEWKQGNQFK